MENEQRLGEFVATLLDDLQSGSITAEEAIIASSRYEYIRSLFSQRAEELAEATISGEETLKSSLISLFSQTKGRLAELPAFSSQTPDIIRDEKQMSDTASLEHAAFETIRKETKIKASSRKQTRREFIHALVNQYSTRTNNAISEAKMDSLVDSVLSGASKEQSSQNAKLRFIKDLSQKLEVSNSAFEKTLGSVVSSDAANTVVLSWKDIRAEKEALVALFTHSDLSRPDVVADVFIHASDKENLSDVSAYAVKLAQTASAISTLGTKQPTIKGSFFSSSNTKGVIKGLQQAADGVLSLAGEPLREIIIKEKISGAIRSVLTNTRELADKLGEQFVQSPLFGFISQNVLKATNEKPSMSQSTAVFSDVFSSIFRGPLNIATTRGAQNHVYDYFTLARASSNAPKGFSFLSTNIMPWHLGFLHADYLLSTKRGSVSRGGWFPSFGLHALQSLSSLAGNTLATIFDRFVGFVFAGSSLSRQVHASRRAATVPLPLSEDLPLLLSIVVVGTIIILYVFPTFLNIPHLSMTQKMSALLASLQSKGEEFHEDNRNFPVPDFGPIKQSPNACIQYGAGTSAPDNKKSYQFNSSQQDKMNTALKAYPQIGLYSCILGCPANTVNFTAFNTTSSSGFWAWAPSAKPGYIFFYNGAFSASSTRSLARLIAHELAHQIQYSKINIYNSYLAKGYCGPLGTYGWTEWPSETFAEAAGMYMIGDPLLKQKCEKGYSFMQNMFSTCQ